MSVSFVFVLSLHSQCVLFVHFAATDKAHGTFAGEQGIVVDMRNSNGGIYLFEALLWSDFTDEREYFFIGGLQVFEFTAVHDVARKKNYGPFVLPMTMLQGMILGFPNQIGPITAENVEALSLLISNCFSRNTTCSRIACPYIG